MLGKPLRRFICGESHIVTFKHLELHHRNGSCTIYEISRFVKIKKIKKQNLLYGCFKKQSTQKISNQKMKSKERDKSVLEYVQCMYNNVHAYKVPGF